jgi:hypothetical protein
MNRSDVPKHLRDLYDRAMSGRSKSAGVKVHCLMCMGWDRKAVKECTAPGCPLYPYRPGGRVRASKGVQNPGAKGGFGHQGSIPGGRLA